MVLMKERRLLYTAIHPSQSGQKLIARTVEQTYLAAKQNAQ
jgi:hypothetical protein